MIWKVRADCTYTTTANKNSRQSAVESLLASYPDAITPPGAGARFSGGVTSQSTTRFTVSFDFLDKNDAIAFKNAVASAVQASVRSQTMISIHEGG